MQQIKIKKGNILTYIIILLCAVAIMVTLKKCSTTLPQKQEFYKRAGGDTINVAIEISPLSLSLAGDTLSGFYYEILKLIEEKNNVAFKLHQFVPLSFALDGLDSRLFDIVVADIPATSNLKEKYLLTQSLYVDYQLLVQHINESTGKVDIEDYNQLASDTVWVVKNSPFIDRITNLTEELGCDTIYVMESEEFSSEQLVILTALGEIKRAVVNANVAKKMAKDYPQLDINTKISFNQFQVWVLKRDNQSLCNRINEWITEIKSSKEYELILQKYIQK